MFAAPAPLIHLHLPARELAEAELHAYDRQQPFAEFVKSSAALLTKASLNGFNSAQTHLLDSVGVAIPLPKLSDEAINLPMHGRATFVLPSADLMRIQSEADRREMSAEERLRRGIRFGNFVATHVIERPVFMHAGNEIRLNF